MEGSKVDETEIIIKEGLTKISFNIPKILDVPTIYGLTKQMSQFLKVFDKTQQLSSSIDEPDESIKRRRSDYFKFNNNDERLEFIKFYEKKGMKRTKEKYNMTQKQIYSRVHHCRQALGLAKPRIY